MKTLKPSFSAVRGRFGRLCAAVCLLFAAFPAQAQQTLPLTRHRGHLYTEALLQDSLPVRIMLESGIPFPLIDSALVWSHPDLFHPEKLDRPVRFRMAAGVLYTASYKLGPGLSAGLSRSLRDTYVVDLGKHSAEMLYPLNHFTSDSVSRPGIFCLDMRGGSLRMLAGDELPAPGGEWTAYDMTRDERTGMYCVAGSLTLVNARGRRTEAPVRLVVDLGNATLLALFAYRPEVKRFVARSRIAKQDAVTPAGKTMRVLQPAEIVFMGAYGFTGLPVLLLETPMRLPGDAFLGLPFFERFRVIFDFRHSRLWVAASDAG